jgi:hypothetical protein
MSDLLLTPLQLKLALHRLTEVFVALDIAGLDDGLRSIRGSATVPAHRVGEIGRALVDPAARQIKAVPLTRRQSKIMLRKLTVPAFAYCVGHVSLSGGSSDGCHRRYVRAWETRPGRCELPPHIELTAWSCQAPDGVNRVPAEVGRVTSDLRQMRIVRRRHRTPCESFCAS